MSLLLRWFPVFLVSWVVGQAAEADPGAELENFEAGYQPAGWSFYNGGEFPGAKGSFARTAAAAHDGKFGGELRFDFTGGGNYVAANLRMPEGGAGATGDWNGLQLWLHRPEGNDFVFRYSDANSQTFQKPVECAAGRWVRVTIPFSGWTAHWGGANDGKVRGKPATLALLVDHGSQLTGALLFDDLRLVSVQDTTASVSYPAYRFASEEGWHPRAEGNGATSRLEGRTWTADFSQGARWLSLGVPDHVLLGNVDKIRLRVKGSAKGHPVRLVLHTHFMTFQKTIGEFSGEGEQELVTDGPPGPGWEWHGGENDGKIHGPLRLGEIGLAGAGNTSPCKLELLELTVDASCPAEKRCVLLAKSQGTGSNSIFMVRARALSDRPLKGDISLDIAGLGRQRSRTRKTGGHRAGQVRAPGTSSADRGEGAGATEVPGSGNQPGDSRPGGGSGAGGLGIGGRRKTRGDARAGISFRHGGVSQPLWRRLPQGWR